MFPGFQERRSGLRSSDPPSFGMSADTRLWTAQLLAFQRTFLVYYFTHGSLPFLGVPVVQGRHYLLVCDHRTLPGVLWLPFASGLMFHPLDPFLERWLTHEHGTPMPDLARPKSGASQSE